MKQTQDAFALWWAEMGSKTSEGKQMNWTIRRGPMAGKIIELVHMDCFSDLPNGTVLYSIFGRKVIKGKDYIDQDDRGGFLSLVFEDAKS